MASPSSNRPLSDKPYDEAISVSGDDASTPASSPRINQKQPSPADSPKKSPVSLGKLSPTHPSPQMLDPVGAVETKSNKSGTSGGPAAALGVRTKRDDASSSSDASSTSSEDEEALVAGQYNQGDYAHLKVSPEITELFQYITRYKPHAIELDTKLKAFIPDFIPAIGEVDACLKIPRPDGKPDGLGLTRLDEPTLKPSDPTVLDLQLRSMSKHQNLHPMEVRSVAHDEFLKEKVKQWITRIDDLHRAKPATMVRYTKKMPEVESLMQVWPADMEAYLEKNPISCLSELDSDSLSLKDYIKVIAVVLDIPVHDGSLTDTLHVLFTLYSEFKNNQHFGGLAYSGGSTGYPGATVGGSGLGTPGVPPGSMHAGDFFRPPSSGGRAVTPV